MQIHVEWTSGVLRLLEGDFGGGYLWSASVVRVGDTLHIKGVSTLPPRPFRMRRLLRKWCIENGIREVVWERAGRATEERHAV